LEVIHELNYRPNILARSLASGKTLSVGLIIPAITDPFYPEVVLGVEEIARQQDYTVVLSNSNEDPQQELAIVETLAGKQVDGFILCGTRLTAVQLSQLSLSRPIVIVTSRHLTGTATVRTRSKTGLREITTHLIGLGHRHIGHLGWRTAEDCERVAGYKSALNDGGLEVDEQRIVFVPRVSIDAGGVALKRLLAQAPDTTAITCYNDLMALGALKACTEMGLHVPKDLAVVGFDDLELASIVTPPLTTMSVDRRQLGETIMHLLLRVMASGSRHEEHIEVTPTMVVRKSCGAQPAGEW
jgi:LacI family transcriptional regulator